MENMDLFLNKSRIRKHMVYYIGLLFYRIVLDFVYVQYVSPKYSYYMGLTTTNNISNIVISYFLMLIIIFFMPSDVKFLANVLLNVQLVIMLVPILTLYAFSDKSIIFTIAVSIAHILQCMIVKIYHFCKHTKIIIWQTQSKIWMYGFLTTILLLAFGYTFYRYGVASLQALDITSVYEIRANVGYGFPFSYIVPWALKVICLFILIGALEKKQYMVTIVISLIQLYFYLIYANKSTLFAWILALGCYVLVKKTDIIKMMIWGLSALAICCSLVYTVSGNIMPLSYLMRRVLFVPARIKFAYYEFFSQNSFLHFADNSIGHLLGISSPYKQQAPKIIAEYLLVPDSYCNTGYWGDAYANFGWLGLTLFSIIIIFLILLIEQWNLPNTYVYPILIVLFYNLNDAALMTWLMGGGGILAILILWLYRNHLRQEKQDEKL